MPSKRNGAALRVKIFAILFLLALTVICFFGAWLSLPKDNAVRITDAASASDFLSARKSRVNYALSADDYTVLSHLGSGKDTDRFSLQVYDLEYYLVSVHMNAGELLMAVRVSGENAAGLALGRSVDLTGPIGSMDKTIAQAASPYGVDVSELCLNTEYRSNASRYTRSIIMLLFGAAALSFIIIILKGRK